MLDRCVDMLAGLVIRLVGVDRCGKAIARYYYGTLGVFMVGFQPPVEDDEDDDEDDGAETGLDPGIWGRWAGG